MDLELSPPEPKEHSQDCGCLECEPPKGETERKLSAEEYVRELKDQRQLEVERKNHLRRAKKHMFEGLSARQARNLQKRLRYIQAMDLPPEAIRASCIAEVEATKKLRGK